MRYRLIKDIELPDDWIIPAGVVFVYDPESGRYEGFYRDKDDTVRPLQLTQEFLDEFGEEYLSEEESGT